MGPHFDQQKLSVEAQSHNYPLVDTAFIIDLSLDWAVVVVVVVSVLALVSAI